MHGLQLDCAIQEHNDRSSVQKQHVEIPTQAQLQSQAAAVLMRAVPLSACLPLFEVMFT